MRVVLDKDIDPSRAFIYVHVPKCGGTYTKSLIDTYLSGQENFYTPDTDMHQSLDSIVGYRTRDSLLFEGVKTTGSVGRIELNFTSFVLCSLRDPFSWYDSYYYFKQTYEERSNEIRRQPLVPLSSERQGDYKQALTNCMNKSYIEKCSATVLQGGFCPSVWMKELDIGFYTAWFLYSLGDHKAIFDNLKNLKGNDLINNAELIRKDLLKFSFFDISQIDENIESALSSFAQSEVSLPRQEVLRKTNYSKGYTKSSDILNSDPYLLERFLWKERLMFKLFFI